MKIFEKTGILNLGFFVVYVINDYIFTQVAGFREKYPTVVQPRHPVHEHIENIVAGQHKSVDDNAGAGAVIDLP